MSETDSTETMCFVDRGTILLLDGWLNLNSSPSPIPCPARPCTHHVVDRSRIQARTSKKTSLIVEMRAFHRMESLGGKYGWLRTIGRIWSALPSSVLDPA